MSDESVKQQEEQLRRIIITAYDAIEKAHDGNTPELLNDLDLVLLSTFQVLEEIGGVKTLENTVHKLAKYYRKRKRLNQSTNK